MKYRNVVFQKMIFMVLGVFGVRIQDLTWNLNHLAEVTRRVTCAKHVLKLYKIQTKSENRETWRRIVLSHVKAMVKN